MLKKILIAAFFFFSTIPPLFAASFYFVPMITYDRYEDSGNVTFYGLAPRIALGYGDMKLDEFYLAIEVFASPFQSLAINTSTPPATSTKTSIRPNYSFGGQLLPGIELDYEVKIFGILGIVQTGFKTQGSMTGYQMGLGLDAVLNDSWSLRGEYLHSRYHDSVFGDQGGLGLVYRFC